MQPTDPLPHIGLRGRGGYGIISLQNDMRPLFTLLLAAAMAAGAAAADDAATAATTNAAPTRMARITADMTHYDRKEGMAVFTGRVHVDDEQYQMHADKAYVFTTETNTLKRIVAIGHVALTNDAKRAYGEKASYYKEGGMVVLYGGNGTNAEIVDESKGQRQTLRGSKIKFWIDSEQVEVLDATIVAPSSGGSGLGGAAGLLR